MPSDQQQAGRVLHNMTAEIIFTNPDDLNPAIADLIELGFDVEVLDWVDDDGPAIWIYARLRTELDQDEFFDWVKAIVELGGGDVVSAGLVLPSQGALAP